MSCASEECPLVLGDWSLGRCGSVVRRIGGAGLVKRADLVETEDHARELFAVQPQRRREGSAGCGGDRISAAAVVERLVSPALGPHSAGGVGDGRQRSGQSPRGQGDRPTRARCTDLRVTDVELCDGGMTHLPGRPRSDGSPPSCIVASLAARSSLGLWPAVTRVNLSLSLPLGLLDRISGAMGQRDARSRPPICGGRLLVVSSPRDASRVQAREKKPPHLHPSSRHTRVSVTGAQVDDHDPRGLRGGETEPAFSAKADTVMTKVFVDVAGLEPDACLVVVEGQR